MKKGGKRMKKAMLLLVLTMSFGIGGCRATPVPDTVATETAIAAKIIATLTAQARTPEPTSATPETALEFATRWGQDNLLDCCKNGFLSPRVEWEDERFAEIAYVGGLKPTVRYRGLLERYGDSWRWKEPVRIVSREPPCRVEVTEREHMIGGPSPPFANRVDSRLNQILDCLGDYPLAIEGHYEYHAHVSYKYDPSRVTEQAIMRFYEESLRKSGFQFGGFWQDVDGTYHLTGRITGDPLKQDFPSIRPYTYRKEVHVCINQFRKHFEVLYMESYIGKKEGDTLLKMKAVLDNRSYSRAEKERKLSEIKRSVGEQLFINAVKALPVYDPENKEWKSVGTWMEEMIRESGGDTEHGSRFERDPIGTVFDLLFKGVPEDPEDLMEILGITDR